MKEDQQHTHIWKYNTANNIRICEAPFPFIKGCRKEEECPSPIKSA